MATTPSPAAISSLPARRPWWRLHLSTWLVLFLAGLVLGYYNLAVFEKADVDGSHDDVPRNEQGWPCIWRWSYTVAEVIPRIGFDYGYVDLSPDFDPKIWPPALLVDGLAALFIFSLLALTLEWRVRSGRSIWQLTLREGLLGVALLAVAFAGMRAMHQRWQRQSAALLVVNRQAKVVATADDRFIPAGPRRFLSGQRLDNGYNGIYFGNSAIHGGPTQTIRTMVLSKSNRRDAGRLDPMLLLNFPDLLRLNVTFPADAAAMQAIGHLHKLNTLGLKGPVPDGCLAHLSRLKELQSLSIVETSDAELAAIPQVPTLRKLQLSGAGLTDECIKIVLQFPDLEELSLRRTSVTDTGVAGLVELKQLKRLDLYGTKFTDEGAARVPELKHLTTLHLNYTNLTDRGLMHLAKCPALEKVFLRRTQITDDGLPYLEQMPTLEDARVEMTNVTPDGIQRLSDHFERKKAAR